MQRFAIESHGFHQNAQKLTFDTKDGQILNIVIKCSLAAGKGTTLKVSIYGRHFQGCHDRIKVCKMRTYKINGKHVHPKNE